MPRDYDDDDDDRPRPRHRDDEDDDRPRRSRRRDDDEDDDRRPAKASSGKSLGLILGIVGGVVVLAGGGIAVLVVVLMGKAQENRAMYVTQNNLRELGTASHTYSDVYASLPSPYVRKPGEPNWQVPTDLDTRLGWRVELLPYLEQGPLYNQFDKNSAWNSSANQPLANRVVSQYADYDTPADPTTRLRCFYDNGALFDTRDRVAVYNIPDGSSNTILYVESEEKVTWSRFQELKYDPNGPLPKLGRADKSTFHVVMADGSVKSVKKTVSEWTLRTAITRADGQVGGDLDD